VRPGWFRSEKVKREKGESEIPATISPGGGGGGPFSGNARGRGVKHYRLGGDKCIH